MANTTTEPTIVSVGAGEANWHTDDHHGRVARTDEGRWIASTPDGRTSNLRTTRRAAVADIIDRVANTTTPETRRLYLSIDVTCDDIERLMTEKGIVDVERPVKDGDDSLYWIKADGTRLDVQFV